MSTPPIPAGVVDAETKARILVEAIPYIRRFENRIVVVKYGGSAIGDPHGGATELSRFAEDIVLMRAVGMLPVVVHGGGPQIGELMERLGKVPEFRDGLRVTDAETLDIARMVLVGKVNRDIVGALNVHGPIAVGLTGEDAGFINATARDPELGFVGDVVSVDPTLVDRLVVEGLVPVIATIGSDDSGQAYNINADTVAGAVAQATSAEKLIFLTDVAGIRSMPSDPGSLLSRVAPEQLEGLIGSGAIEGGMVPKAEACIEALRGGVAAAHVLDGRIEHALLLELFTDEGLGTMVVGT